jgi:hypothetical protein
MEKIFILRYYKFYKFNLHVKTKKWTNIKIILHTILHKSHTFRSVLTILRSSNVIKAYTSVSQMKTLNMFYHVIYLTQMYTMTSFFM